jgi:8-oxo-dGTP diphosphatase
MSDIVGCIFISNDSGKVLLLKRSMIDPKDNFKGYWSIVTGHMEKGELPYQSIDREVSEELGVPKNEFKFSKYKVYKTRNNKNLYLYYSLVPEEFKPSLNNENTDFQWYDQDNLPKKLYPETGDKIKSIISFLTL